MKTYSFEKLEVWKVSKSLTKDIYVITKLFPEEEKFGMTSQLRRAVISVSCNIAEGTSRWSKKEKVRYIEIAFGSLMEVLNCLIICQELNYINQKKLNKFRVVIDEIANKLNALSNSFKK